MTFTDYAAKNNIKLLKDDIAWLRVQLNKLPKAEIKAVMKRYIEIWVHVAISCEDPLKRDNEGRRAANTYILELTRCERME